MLASVSTVGIAWPGNPARTRPPCSSTTIRPSGSDSTAVGWENVVTRLSVKPAGTVAADTGADGPPTATATGTRVATMVRIVARRMSER